MIMHDNGVMRGVGRSDVGENAFKFTDIAGMVAWFEDDTSPINEAAGLVSQQGDKSGNLNHKTQGTAARQAETGVRTLNSLNAFDYLSDGYNTTIDFSDAAQFNLTTGITFFIVIETDATASSSSPDYFLDQSVGSTGFSLRMEAGTVDMFLYDTVTGLMILNGVGSISVGTATIFMGEISTAGAKLYQDNVLIGSDNGVLTAIANPSQNIVIGNEYSYSGKALNGLSPFQVFYENILTNAEKNSASQELGDRYNITVGTL